tara:strand:+ start:39 stop:296 length:258 start_codon:yes stop_codon:yes gene_type:complete
MAKGKTQTYYDKNPAANKRRLAQQKRYNEGKGNGKRTGREITIAANKLRAKLKLPVGDSRDASHYKGSKTKGRPLSKKKNRSRKA